MSLSTPKDIGAHIKVLAGTPPLNDTGSTVNGGAIDRQGYASCKLALVTGAATGSPTTQTADAKLQDSADGSTDWQDLDNAAVTQVTADDTLTSVDVSLDDVQNANNEQCRRYIRVVRTVAFTGGTSPDWPVATPVVLGGADRLPAA